MNKLQRDLNTKNNVKTNDIKTITKQIKQKIRKLQTEKPTDINLENELKIYKLKAEIAGWVDEVKIEKIKILEKSEKNEAVAFCVASDWHIGETIEPSVINGVNAYNLRIAEERIKNFFVNTIKLINICKKNVKINAMVFALLGDLINGYIHEEYEIINSISPVQEIIKLKTLLINGINYFLKNFDGDIIIPCVVGNHGDIRNSGQKPKVASQVKNSFEWLLYNEIQDFFKKNKRIKFNISDGYFTIIEVYGRVIRLHHGHNIKYNGGIGGITIPVNKAIAQWNKIPPKPANFDIFGHFHQYAIHKNWLSNGSICGFNAYAIKIKAEYEEPKQAFFLLDKKRGITINAPILT